MIETGKAQEYRDLLRSYDLYLIGLVAPLDVVEARERARGNREIGLARGQYDLVHRGIAYDLEVNTSTATPAECARIICDSFGL